MAHQYADKYARSHSDIPQKEHWAIIKGTSVTIPGDERSRTAPGHGYPERTEYYLDYEVYLTEEKFLEAMEYKINSTYQENIIGIHVDKIYVPGKKKVDVMIVG